MKATLICILLIVVLGAFAVGSFVLNVERAKELKNMKKKERENAKIDKETMDSISTVAGDDIHAGNDILHQLAEKRK